MTQMITTQHPKTGRRGDGDLLAADWLSLAAAPTFATMAVLTGALAGGPKDMICSGTQHASLLSGMAPMYVLMSGFHLSSWLRLLTRGSGTGRS